MSPTSATARSTRQAYAAHLVDMMATDPRIVCLDTDTGLFTQVDFGPAAARYIDLGIAEHTLMAVAAGMAARGWVPYVNTMATFVATRAAEAVKLDVAYNNLPVRIVATHAGVSAGHLGPSHHGLEDLAMMRTLPNMTVVVPGDVAATVSLLDQTRAVPGPVYIRLGRQASPDLPDIAARPVLGSLQVLHYGRDAVLVCAGPHAVHAALGGAALLRQEGVHVAVAQAHTIKPFDTGTLVRLAADTDLVVTVEEHWRTAGLGSLVTEVLAERSARRVVRIGFPDTFVGSVGTQQELLESAGVSATGVAASIRAHRQQVDRGGSK